MKGWWAGGGGWCNGGKLGALEVCGGPTYRAFRLGALLYRGTVRFTLGILDLAIGWNDLRMMAMIARMRMSVRGCGRSRRLGRGRRGGRRCGH